MVTAVMSALALAEPDFERVFERVYGEVYGDGAHETYAVFPEARRFLSTAREEYGLVVGCLSNADERYRTHVLPSLGLSAAVDFVLTSRDAGHEKPDARAFEMAVEMGAAAAAAAKGEAAAAMERWVHVGDSEAKDVAGAEAAGMHAVLLDRGAPAGGRGGVARSLMDVFPILAGRGLLPPRRAGGASPS